MTGQRRRLPWVVAFTVALLVPMTRPADAHTHPTPTELAAPAVVYVQAGAQVEVALVEHQRPAPHLTIIQSTSKPVLMSASGFVVDPTGAVVTSGVIHKPTADELERAGVYAVNEAFQKRYPGRITASGTELFDRQRIGSADDVLQQRLDACYPPNHTPNDAGGCVVRVTPTYTVYPHVNDQRKYGQLPAELLDVSTSDVAVLRVRGGSGMPAVNLGQSTEGAQALSVLGFAGIPDPTKAAPAIKTHLAEVGSTDFKTKDVKPEEAADNGRLAEGLRNGMLGGPAVAEKGQVVGFLVPEAGSGPPPAQPGRLIAADSIQKLLDKAGIKPHQGPVDTSFERASHNFKNDYFQAAIPDLQATLKLSPVTPSPRSTWRWRSRTSPRGRRARARRRRAARHPRAAGRTSPGPLCWPSPRSCWCWRPSACFSCAGAGGRPAVAVLTAFRRRRGRPGRVPGSRERPSRRRPGPRRAGRASRHPARGLGRRPACGSVRRCPPGSPAPGRCPPSRVVGRVLRVSRPPRSPGSERPTAPAVAPPRRRRRSSQRRTARRSARTAGRPSVLTTDSAAGADDRRGDSGPGSARGRRGSGRRWPLSNQARRSPATGSSRSSAAAAWRWSTARRTLRLGRKVALKLLTPQLADSEQFRQRFIRESRLAASLDHPNIVPIYEAGEADGQLFIAMRYVIGPDLKGLLAEQGGQLPAGPDAAAVRPDRGRAGRRPPGRAGAPRRQAGQHPRRRRPGAPAATLTATTSTSPTSASPSARPSCPAG